MPVPTVFKPTALRPLPDNAELFERDGRPHARWRDSGGNEHIAPVCVPDKGPHAGQQRIVIESDRYVVRYQDESGAIRTVNTDLRDEDQARRLLDQLLQQVAAARQANAPVSQVVKPPRTGEAPRIVMALRDHFRDYVKQLKSHETPAARIADIERQVRRVARQCGFLRLSEIKADAVNKWLLDREADGMPATARNAHLDDLMDFVEWCLREKRLPQNPLTGITRVQETVAAATLAVRPLSEKELVRLLRLALWRPLAEYGRAAPEHTELDLAAPAPRFTPLTIETIDELVARGRRQLEHNPKQIARLRSQGWQRALIYKTLALIGLRRSEMVSLRTGMVRLKRKSPVLLVGAKANKETAGTAIPLRADLAADLRLWLRYRWRAARKTGRKEERDALRKSFLRKPLFKLPAGLGKLLAIDLHAVGITEVDGDGVRIDVYAARNHRDTLLAREGTPIAHLWAKPTGPADDHPLRQGLLKVFKLRRRKDN